MNPSPFPALTWDIIYTVPVPPSSSPSSSPTHTPRTATPTWLPTTYTPSRFHALKTPSHRAKERADATLLAMRTLSREIRPPSLVLETDEVGKAASYFYTAHALPFRPVKKMRLQAIKSADDGTWKAIVWPGVEDLGWPEHRTATGKTLEACLRDLVREIGRWKSLF